MPNNRKKTKSLKVDDDKRKQNSGGRQGCPKGTTPIPLAKRTERGHVHTNTAHTNKENKNTHNRQKTLKIGQWNINGIRTKTQDKLGEGDVLEWIQGLDIAAFTETHLEAGEGLPVPGYRVFEANRKRNKAASRCSGGVAVAVKRRIAEGITRIPCKSTEMVWLKMNRRFFHLPRDIAIGIIYEGPQQSTVKLREDKDAFAEVQDQMDKLPLDMEIILMGDMNARTKMWTERITTEQSTRQPTEAWGIERELEKVDTRINQDTETNGQGMPFINLCRRNELTILNGRTEGDRRGMYTSFQKGGHSLVDYAVASTGVLQKVRSFTVDTLRGDLSDHAPIITEINVEIHSSRLSREAEPTGTPLTTLKWAEGAPEIFREEIQRQQNVDKLTEIKAQLQQNPDRTTIEEAVKKLTAILITTTEKAGKFTKTRQNRENNKRRNKIWYDRDCEKARIHVKQLGERVQKGEENKRAEFYKARTAHKKLRKWKLKQFKRKMLNKMATLDSENQNAKYWQTLTDLKNEERRLTGISVSMEQWVTHFQKLLNKTPSEPTVRTPPQQQPTERDADYTTYDPVDAVITEIEVKTQIKKNKNNKATFLDNVSSEMLKYAGETIVPALTQIYNAVLSTGNYPTQWKGATLTPLHKKGDWDLPSNYRGIAVSGCLGKTFNAMLNNRLTDFMQRSGLSHKYQTGFERGGRTTDNTLTITTIIDQAKSNKQKLYMCFVDLTKAYDTVDRNKLFLKLRNAGIGTKFLAVLKDMFTGVEYVIKLAGRASRGFYSNRGLKQGDGMSPKLFNCFTADAMLTLLQETEVPYLDGIPIPALFFADDLVLMATTAEALQRLINRFTIYCEENSLEINENKTKTMVVGKLPRSRKRREQVHQHKFYVNGTELEAVQTFSYLGIDFHAAGAVPASNNSMTLKGERAQARLASMTREAPVQLALKLYKQLVEPIILYGTEIWAPYALTRTRKQSEDILDTKTVHRVNSDTLQSKYIKKILGTKKRSINNAIMGEVGARPLFAMAMERTMRYVRAVEKIQGDALVATALKVQKQMHVAGKQCWYKGLQRLTRQTGGTENKKGEVRKNLEKRHLEKWETETRTTCRLEFYTEVKQEYKMEEYLKYEHRKVRRAYSRYRTSDHNLRIEKDRWTTTRVQEGSKNKGTPREERLCTKCTEKEVEDETHIFTCPAYRDLRNKYGINARTNRDIYTAVALAKPNTMWFVYQVMKMVDRNNTETPPRNSKARRKPP